MKKLIILLIVIIISLLLTNNSIKERDLEYGSYMSEKLVRVGMSSILLPTNPIGRPSGMEYIISENQYVIKNVDEVEYSTITGGIRELVFKDVTYEEVTLIPDYKIIIWERIVDDLESIKLYKVLDDENNKIPYEIVILNDELYIMHRSLFSIDKIIQCENQTYY